MDAPVDPRPPAGTAAGPAPLRAWLALGVLALPTLLVAIDVSVMVLALPQIGASLGASATQTLWIMDIYGFMLAGFSITMGTLGDRIGRRKLLLAGAAAFAAASIAAAFSPNVASLILARACLGVAGAAIPPAILGLISQMFADPRERALAIGVWMACFMGGMSLGPLAGGVVLEHFWWGAVFLLGVPAMVPLLIAGPLLLPEYRAAEATPIDLGSVALSLAAILPVVFALKEAARQGPQPELAAALLAGLVFAGLFVRRERRLAAPLLDLALFRAPAFSAMLLANFFVAATGTVLLFVSQYLQLVAHLSPLQTGLAMLPGPLAMMLGVLAAPLLARRFSISPFIALGLAGGAAGLLVLTAAGADGGLAAVVVGFTIFNVGCAPMVALSTDLVIGAAPPERAGSAGALLQIAGDLAFSLGIAVLGSLGIAIYRGALVTSLPPELAPAARAASLESLAAAAETATRLGGEAGEALRAVAAEAFLGGFRAAAILAAASLGGVALLCAQALRGRGPLRKAG